MRRLFILLLVVFLPLYVFLKGVETNAFNTNFYLDSFGKHGVMDTTGKELEELEIITEGIISYLKDKTQEEGLRPYFNDEEIQHMEDVKFLFRYGFIIKYISLALFLVAIIGLLLLGESNKIAYTIFYGNLIWWIFMLILFFLTTMDFNKYFTYFHMIFFDNDLWLLDPEKDLLIQMLPEEFFIGIFNRILLFFVSILAIIQVVSYILMKKEKGSNECFDNIKRLF